MTNTQCRVIVSLTSFPPAIPYAIKAVQSILDGSVLPDKVVLYVTLAQFDDAKLPDDLVALAAANPRFEIRDYPRDIRSYRKLIPALIDFPDDIIVTVDDDVHYHRHMLRDLLALHRELPNVIIAHRAKHIKRGRPYKKWSKYRWYHFLFKRIHRSYATLQTGVGGVLYPPHVLREDMLDPDLFTQIAPTTDDIWFWAAAVANHVPIVPLPHGKNKPRGVGKPGELSLKWSNFKRGIDRNSAALEAIIARYPEVGERLNEKMI